jgi:glucan phosphoethanolaminetransferase (alkaline phosphatase superfamily)
MISNQTKNHVITQLVFLLWACSVAFLVYMIGPRRMFVDFARPFFAAYLICIFIRTGASSGKLLRLLSGILAMILPIIIFCIAFAAAYFISIGHPLSVEDVDAMLQSYGGETLGFIKTIMFTPKKMVFSLFLLAFTVFVGFFAFFSKRAKSETRLQRLLPVVLLIIAAFLISQFKVTRLYFETRSEYIKNIEIFHQINDSLPAPDLSLEIPANSGRYTFQQIKECVFDLTCYNRRSPLYEGIIYEEAKSLEENLARLNEFARNIDTKHGVTATVPGERNGELYVLIIGESSGRDTLHAYGGPAKNTPWLDNFKDRKDVLFFKNAYAPFTYTIPALTHALTDGRMATGATFPHGNNIIGISKANSFHTVWISNQEMLGPAATPISAIASTAHESFFTTIGREYFDDVPPDEAILPLIKNYMEKHDFSRNTLLVIHLIGSHAPYEARYPKNFPLIDETDMIHMGDVFTTPKAFEAFTTYATSQKYTDYILKEIFTLFEKYQSKPIVATYFSDHGEDPFVFAKHGISGHDSQKGFSWSMSRIPFFMWYSPQFARLHSDKLALLKERKDSPFTNDLIYDFYVGLSGIKANTYLPQFDIGSDEYAVTWENSFVTGKRSLAEDPAFIIEQNIKKASQAGISLGVHYTNTIFKYRQAKNYLRNFELDLMLRPNNKTSKNDLMLGHDTARQLSDLSFQQYLVEMDDEFDFLWLDIKNLDNETSKEILMRLSTLDKEFDLKRRVLVESLSAESLLGFAKNGWATSLYVHPLFSVEANDKKTSSRIINQIVDDVKKYQIGGVSYHIARIDPSVLEQFKIALPADIKFYGWAVPRWSQWSFSDQDLIDKISKYSYLEILLIPFESDFSFAYK